MPWWVTSIFMAQELAEQGIVVTPWDLHDSVSVWWRDRLRQFLDTRRAVMKLKREAGERQAERMGSG